MTRRYLFLLIMIVVLFAASLVVGSVDIPMRDVIDILTGRECGLAVHRPRVTIATGIDGIIVGWCAGFQRFDVADGIS